MFACFYCLCWSLISTYIIVNRYMFGVLCTDCAEDRWELVLISPQFMADRNASNAGVLSNSIARRKNVLHNWHVKLHASSAKRLSVETIVHDHAEGITDAPKKSLQSRHASPPPPPLTVKITCCSVWKLLECAWLTRMQTMQAKVWNWENVHHCTLAWKCQCVRECWLGSASLLTYHAESCIRVCSEFHNLTSIEALPGSLHVQELKERMPSCVEL